MKNSSHSRIIFVRALQAPIYHIHAHYRFVLDETPLNPDALILKSYTTLSCAPLSCSRASIWTLLPVLRSDRGVLATLLLQIRLSIPVDSAKFTSANSSVSLLLKMHNTAMRPGSSSLRFGCQDVKRRSKIQDLCLLTDTHPMYHAHS